MSTSPNTPERRRFSRVAFNTITQLKQGDCVCEGELLDISLKGVLIKPALDCTLDLKAIIEVSIQLADDAIITMSTQHTRSMNDTLGLTCQSIDVESISHLRRLIELNLGDPNASERELSELLGAD
jgi:PilZ domain